MVTQPQIGLLNNSHLRNINGGTFNNVAGDSHINNSFVNSSTNPLERLHSFIATGAMHDSNERFPQPKCHPSTRERILQRILNWVESDSCERILWLSGSAGTGKSAIAQTISERCKRNDRLAATFFFFRTGSERNTSERLVATLAYQIALSVSGAREFIAKAVEDDLSVFSKDIHSQLFQLIVRPLTLAAQGWDSTQQLLVIIDGLDECVDKRQQTDILSAICNAFMNHELPLRFLICSRPEHDIQMRFERSDLQSATARLVVDMDDTVTQDITTFLEVEFSRIHREHCIQETPWPPEGVIQSLAKRASGQFIYASTVIKFIDDGHFQPQQRLDMVFGTLPRGTYSPFAEIDLLYTQILDAVPASKIEKTLFCLGAIMAQYGGYSAFLNKLLQLNPGGVEHLLRELHSVLEVQEYVSIRHKSFSDFLTCKARSGGHYIDIEIVRGEVSGLLWATIPRCLSQISRLPDWLSLDKDSPLKMIIMDWKICLPAGRHARATLQELANIADFLEKNDKGPHESNIKLFLGKKFLDFYPCIISWLSKEKLDEKNPILWKRYISLFNKEILHFLKGVEFLDPIHSIHFLAFKIPQWFMPDLAYVGDPGLARVFLDFFLDPSRSGKYHLTPQHHADIAGWMIQYHHSLSVAMFARRFCRGANMQIPFSKQWLRHGDQSMWITIVIHLSRASPCAEQLIDVICYYNPETFPLICPLPPNNISSRPRVKQLQAHDDYKAKVRKAITRYLLDNSQMYEEWLAVKREEDRKIQSSLTYKLGTVPLLHVVCYLLILAVYFGFQWVFFPLPDPRSCSP